MTEIKNRLSRRLEQERNILILAGYNKGMTQQDLATLLNMSVSRIYQIILKNDKPVK